MSTTLVQKRNNSTAAGVLMIGSGALTAIASAGFVLSLGWVCVGLLWIFPLIAGLGEMVVGASIIGGQPTSRVRGVSAVGMVSALMSLNFLGVLFEIIAQVLLAKAQPQLEARDW